MQDSTETTTKSTPHYFEQLQAIACICLPEGWIEGTPHTRRFSVMQVLHPADDASTSILVYQRKLSLPDTTARAFRQTLSESPHELSPEEIAQLADVLEDQCDASVFNLNTARTTDWNGNRVLLTEGNWMDFIRHDLTLHVCGGEEGEWLEKVIVANRAEAPSLRLDQAYDALSTIEWRMQR